MDPEKIELLRSLGFSEELMNEINSAQEPSEGIIVEQQIEAENISVTQTDSTELIIKMTERPFNFVINQV